MKNRYFMYSQKNQKLLPTNKTFAEELANFWKQRVLNVEFLGIAGQNFSDQKILKTLSWQRSFLQNPKFLNTSMTPPSSIITVRGGADLFFIFNSCKASITIFFCHSLHLLSVSQMDLISCCLFLSKI